MATNVKVIALTQPGVTGNVTYSLPANFDPKAIILFGCPVAADGSAAHASYGFGFGTYRGGVAQGECSAFISQDAVSTSDTRVGNSGGTVNASACFALISATAGSFSVDLEIDLVSMQTGATSEVVLNWFNRHTVANIRIFMMVLGGDDITDAVVGAFTCTSAVTVDDVALPAGFGHPDVVFFTASLATAGFSAANSPWGIGFAKKGEAGRGFAFTQTDGAAGSVNAITQRSDRCVMRLLTTPALTMSGQLAAEVNWPDDGFELVYDANPGSPAYIPYLAIRSNGKISTGANVVPSSGGVTVVDSNAGFPPKGALMFSWGLAADAAIQSAADQTSFGIGACDGTDGMWAGFTEGDGLATTDANSVQEAGSTLARYSTVAGFTWRATGSFTGNNVRLTLSSSDFVAREFQWIAFGDGTQKARPDADVSGAGVWKDQDGNISNIFQAVDETAASDADYVQSGLSPGSTEVVELGLSDITP